MWLSPMYLSPSLSAAMFSVTLQICKPSLFLSLAHSLALISHPHPLYSLLFWTQPLCLSLSLPLFLSSATLTVTFQTCTPSLSLSHVLAFLSLQPCSPPLFFYVVDATSFALFLSLSLSHYLSLSLSSATLTHFTIFCCGRHLPPFLSLSLSLFSHTHPFYSLLMEIRPLCVYLQQR